MRHTIAPGVVLARSLLTGRARVYVDEYEVEPYEPGRYRVLFADGSPVMVALSRPRWDGAELVTVDGIATWVSRRLRWYESIAVLLPFVLILGGAIPAALGAAALAANLTIVRARRAIWVRLAACLGVFALAAGVAVAIGVFVV